MRKIVLGKDLRRTFELTFGVKWDGQRNRALSNAVRGTNGSYTGKYSRIYQSTQESKGDFYQFVAQDIIDRTGKDWGRCLDVGCGAGRLTYEVAKEFCGVVYGIDSAAEAIRLAKQNHNRFNLHFKTMHVEDMVHSFSEGNHSLVFSRNALYFVVDPVEAIRDMHWLLKPDGMIYIQLINRDKEKIILEEIARFQDKEFSALHLAGCPVLWREAEFRQLLDETGLKYSLTSKPFTREDAQKYGAYADMEMVATVYK